MFTQEITPRHSQFVTLHLQPPRPLRRQPQVQLINGVSLSPCRSLFILSDSSDGISCDVRTAQIECAFARLQVRRLLLLCFCICGVHHGVFPPFCAPVTHRPGMLRLRLCQHALPAVVIRKGTAASAYTPLRPIHMQSSPPHITCLSGVGVFPSGAHPVRLSFLRPGNPPRA